MPMTSAAIELRVHLLGPPRFALDEQLFGFRARPKTLPLLCSLLLHRDGALSRAALAFSLWPDDEEEKARTNLRRHLRYLAQALPVGPEPWIVVSGNNVGWNPRAPLWLDVAEFERWIAAGDPAAAVELYRGDLLEGCYDECLVAARDRLRAAYLAALADLVLTRRAARDFRSATEYARRLLQADPWREDIVRELMAVRYESGDATGALAEFDRFARLVRAELNAEPMPETIALRGTVMRGAAAALPFGERRNMTNLPVARTSLIGRELEITEIVSLLPQSRLVTVTGAGGVGKTRTALAVGDALIEDTPGGVWFIELAPLAHGSLLASAVARVFDVRESPDRPLLETLLAFLKGKSPLLILDNCEQAIEDAAAFADALLRDCPQLRILATSREPLRIAGEQTFRLPSLRFPTRKDDEVLTACDAAAFSAVELFVDRARAVEHRFTLTDENASLVADICRRLDGIALAIELAAARLKMLSPQELRDRLNERFRVLTSGGRDRLPRHRTLRALIDWSHDLLDQRERQLFRRLAFFANGFTLEAASAVAGGVECDAFEVLDLLASLVEKSLVMADPSGELVRYRFLESTRIYAAEKLVEAGERDAIASRHLRYFRDRFEELRRDYEQLRPGLDATFATELDDVRVALDAALKRCELVDGAALLVATGVSWELVGLGHEGITRCESFLAELPRSESRLLGGLGVSLTALLYNTGRYAQACEAGVAAIGYARASGDGPVLASALEIYTFLLMSSHDFSAAECALSEAEAIEGLSPRRRLLLMDCRGMMGLETGDLNSAAQTYETLREAWRSAGFHRNEALAMHQLADVAFRQRQYVRANDLMYEAVSLARHNDLIESLPFSLVILGQMLAVSGEVDAAIGPAIEAIMLWAPHVPWHFHVTLAIEVLAYIAAVQGDHDRSARLAGYADTSLTRIGFARDYGPRAVHERLMTALREHLAPNELARLMAEGASLAPEIAIDLACTPKASATSQRSDFNAPDDALGRDTTYDERPILDS